MNNTVKNRKGSKQSHIAAILRQRVVSGIYPPQAPLPIRTQLMAEFGVSIMTLQKVMDQLTQEGFVRSRGGSGTFVTERPPHLSHYAVVFPFDPGQSNWGQFFQGLANEALAVDRVGERKVTCYYGLAHPDESEDYQTLVRKIQSGQLAGLIFAAPPFECVGTPLMDHPGVGRVGVMTPWGWPEGKTPISCVVPDLLFSFFDRAVEYLAQRGRRSPAVFFNSGPAAHTDYHNSFLAAVAKHGMKSKPRWSQFIDVFDPAAAMHVSQAVMHREQSEPPDSLIISDDTMLESATAGLAAAGIRIPTEVEVVAHCNAPWLTRALVPVKRLGFDLRELLQNCIASIDRQRQGLEVEPRHVAMPARFDHEMNLTAAPPVAARG